ncbi:nucleoside deaminase [Frigoribacterium sp. PhB24]|uniref:nucleoside deaminase n=1 Tax=Frigoribacterium sp. PhB24 TaxID=2485204 RepID=UPI000F4A8612|nr:nucleoside deaminase [Frigoribacterium sp. PhB24]ROS50337.1 tRNA(Arg) A34 adenosine deaminase TadA [Frigoribacterium sp. PhB24]
MTTDTTTHDPTVTPADLARLHRAIEVAQQARDHGNHPFGSLLLTSDGEVVEAENTVVTEGDPTGHAETNLVRLVAQRFDKSTLKTATLYTSTEPCAMCAGAIHWAGIGRVVYALAEQQLLGMVTEQEGESTLDLPCREVFARGGGAVSVSGPALVDEAAAVHAGFWS